MKTGRNEPCPCGSGKKYKKCCINKDQQVKQMHSGHNGPVQPSSSKTGQKTAQELLEVGFRPYVLAKMCDPKEKHIQEMFRQHPELKQNEKHVVSIPKIRCLSTEQLIKKISEQGIHYDEEQFLATCETVDSAWDVAETLWPEQMQSRKKNVSDIAGLGACILWERLYDEKKTTKVSVEMLDDRMENGYKLLDEDRFKACRLWMKVWETFKDNYDLAGMSIEELDARFNGTQSFYNWCQDFEMELINASIDSKEYAEMGVTYLNEFLDWFADEDVFLVNQLKSTLGEFYCRSGNQDTGEKIMKELIRQYPNKMIGYIGMEMAVSIRKMDDELAGLEERLLILEAAKKFPVIDGNDYDLDSRILHLKERIMDLKANR